MKIRTLNFFNNCFSITKTMQTEQLDVKLTGATKVTPHEVACRILHVSGETFELNSVCKNIMKKR